MSDPVILFDPKGTKYLVQKDGAVVRVPGLGSVRPERLAASLGKRVTIGTKSFLVLMPSGRDLRETIEHGPQTLTYKDLAAILYETDVRAGHRVVEGGSGSGSLTIALARLVGATGHVYSYDFRKDSLELAQRNVLRAGVAGVVEFRQADLRSEILERDVDAVILDLPDPWAAVPAAWDAIRPCGHLATFSPNMEQVKETVAAIRQKPFMDIRTIEIIEREMEVRDVGVRPSFAALGHTSYLTFARKVLESLEGT